MGWRSAQEQEDIARSLARQVVSPRLSALRGAHLKRVRSALMANGFFCFTCTDTLLFHIRYYYTACSGDASCPTPFFLPFSHLEEHRHLCPSQGSMPRYPLISVHFTLLTHSFYEPLRPLIKALAGILVIDRHWLLGHIRQILEATHTTVNEAFQRLILKFMIDNRGKEFMDHPVEKTIRKVEGVQRDF